MATFSGASAIVTGAGSGIGRALVLELARRGADVTATDVDEAGLAATLAQIGAQGGRVVIARVDVRDAGEVRAAIDQVVARCGRLDYVFNNAGTIVHRNAVEHSPEEWQRTLDVNVRGVMNGCVAALPHLVAQRGGHLVNTASIAGLLPLPAFPVYSFTKFAVVGLSLNLRAELRRHGVRVTVLCPGGIRTPMTAPLVAGLPEREARMRDSINLDPGDFARSALDAVLANRAIVVRPRWYALLWWLYRVFPSVGNLFVGFR